MQRRYLGRILMVAAGVVVLVVAHGGALYVVWSHLGLSGFAIAGVIVIGLLKHLGLFSPFYLLSKWCSRPSD